MSNADHWGELASQLGAQDAAPASNDSPKQPAAEPLATAPLVAPPQAPKPTAQTRPKPAADWSQLAGSFGIDAPPEEPPPPPTPPPVSSFSSAAFVSNAPKPQPRREPLRPAGDDEPLSGEIASNKEAASQEPRTEDSREGTRRGRGRGRDRGGRDRGGRDRGGRDHGRRDDGPTTGAERPPSPAAEGESAARADRPPRDRPRRDRGPARPPNRAPRAGDAETRSDHRLGDAEPPGFELASQFHAESDEIEFIDHPQFETLEDIASEYLSAEGDDELLAEHGELPDGESGEGGDADDEPRRRRRRRRRRGGRRRREPGDETSQAAGGEREITDSEDIAGDFDDRLDRLDGAGAEETPLDDASVGEARPDGEAAASESEQDLESRRRPRRRRRGTGRKPGEGRERGERTPAEEGGATPRRRTAPAARDKGESGDGERYESDEFTDQESDEYDRASANMPLADDGEPEGDSDDPHDKNSHRMIPSWEDAVGMIVAVNMEARSKSPRSSGAPRGRGRGRGGRPPSRGQ